MNYFTVWSVYIFKGVFTVQSWDPHTQIFNAQRWGIVDEQWRTI